jgi:gliding motility-associated protein GldE
MLLFINRRVKKYVVRNTKAISMRDLSHMLELTEGEISEDKEILEGIVKFGKIYVSEVYHPRMDIVALNINTNFNEVLDVVTSSGYSRIPVYSKSLDDIRGILYVKDLLPHLNQPSTFRWQTLLRPGYFVPESKRISELLKEFQTNKIHMALVIDEYGGIQGLVTLEDILEEIVGEIVDETDEESPLFKQLNDEEFIFEAKISLIDFYKIAGLPDNILDDAKGEAETLAGFILELIGEIPDKDLKISHKNILFEVIEVDDKRIKKIKVKIDRIFEKKGEG